MNESEKTAPPPLLVDIKEAARRLSISDRSVFSLTKAGLLRCVRLGRAVRYDPRELLAFVDRQRVGPASGRAPEGMVQAARDAAETGVKI